MVGPGSNLPGTELSDEFGLVYSPLTDYCLVSTMAELNYQVFFVWYSH